MKTYCQNVKDNSTITDRKLPELESGLLTNYQSDITQESRYYPFGMMMDLEDSLGYRFGFQGQEVESEIAGVEGAYSFFKYRISDNRLGRFFAVDPLSPDFPWNSPYAFSENRLIDGIEWEGLEVVLIGANLTGSYAGSVGLEGGIAIAPEGIYRYGSFEYGVESDINLSLTGSITIFPDMPSADPLKGAGSSEGFGAGEGIVGSTSQVYGGGYEGTNFQVGFGIKTHFLGSVSLKKSQTALMPLSKGAQSYIQNKALREVLWAAKSQLYEDSYKPLTERKNALLSTIESFRKDIAKYEKGAGSAENQVAKEYLKGKAFDTRKALISTYDSLKEVNESLENAQKTMDLIDHSIEGLK